MNVKHQVFVSSTYRDLEDERRAVMQIVLELDCIPAGMELFPASDDDAWTLIKKVIDSSDYYLVVIGGRYGSLTGEEISFTEAEYDYAVQQKKPVVAFIREPHEHVPVGKTDQQEDLLKKLVDFRNKARRKTTKTWSTPQDLASAVAVSLTQLRQSHPTEGWIRPSDADQTQLLKQIYEFRKQADGLKARVAEMEMRERAAEEFANGDDRFEIEYSLEGEEESHKRETSVNDILRTLRLYPLNWKATWDIRNQLKALVKPGELTQDSVWRCLSQLVALGLLLRDAEASDIRWRYTVAGADEVIRAFAVKKSEVIAPPG